MRTNTAEDRASFCVALLIREDLNGRGSGGPVPSLLDMCINVLQDHIDAMCRMKMNGYWPPELIGRLFGRCSTSQLRLLEDSNSDDEEFVKAIDPLWKKHCMMRFNVATEGVDTPEQLHAQFKVTSWKILYERKKRDAKAQRARAEQSVLDAYNSTDKPSRKHVIALDGSFDPSSRSRAKSNNSFAEPNLGQSNLFKKVKADMITSPMFSFNQHKEHLRQPRFPTVPPTKSAGAHTKSPTLLATSATRFSLKQQQPQAKPASRSVTSSSPPPAKLPEKKQPVARTFNILAAMQNMESSTHMMRTGEALQEYQNPVLLTRKRPRSEIKNNKEAEDENDMQPASKQTRPSFPALPPPAPDSILSGTSTSPAAASSSASVLNPPAAVKKLFDLRIPKLKKASPTTL